MRRLRFLVLTFALVVVIGWCIWNWPRRVDMAGYVPADSLGFIEANDLVELAEGISNSEAWTKLAAPLGAKSTLLPNRWLIRVARYAGIGSSEAVLLARSQFALVFSDIQTRQVDTDVNVKPVATLLIETHTMQRRMRPVIEKRVEELARSQGLNLLAHKQTEGVDLDDWSSSDGTRHIIAGLVGTEAIIGNDESAVLKCAGVRAGRIASLSENQELNKTRQQLNASTAPLFGYVGKTGVKPITSAWLLDRFRTNASGIAFVPIAADILSNLIDGFAWTSRFTDGSCEDRFLVSLSEGVTDKLRSNLVPDGRIRQDEMAFIPKEAYSISVYHFHDTDGAWRDVNAALSSHSGVVGAVVARQVLRGLFPPYGISDPDTFVRSAGSRIETMRMEENSSAVLVADAFDRPGLRSSTQKAVSSNAKSEKLNDAELILSSSNAWAESFVGNRFLIGPAELVRTCLQANAENRTLTSLDAYKRADKLVDVSMPIIALTFTDDRRSAISFVEMFSQSERSAFSANASIIESESRSLPLAVNVTLLKQNGFEWTSRSSFGLLGSIAVKLAPGTSR